MQNTVHIAEAENIIVHQAVHVGIIPKTKSQLHILGGAADICSISWYQYSNGIDV